MSRKPRVPWVEVGPEPYLATCQRCGGAVLKPELPVSVDGFVAYCRYAEELHAGCPKPVHAQCPMCGKPTCYGILGRGGPCGPLNRGAA